MTALIIIILTAICACDCDCECGCCAELAVAIVVNLASGLALRIEPVLNQGDQGENLMPPSLFLIPDVPDVPEVPWAPSGA